MTVSILQSQFIEKSFKKAENSEQNVVLFLFLFTLDIIISDRFYIALVSALEQTHSNHVAYGYQMSKNVPLVEFMYTQAR